MAESFYVATGEGEAERGRFESSDYTRGPWDEGSQHAGPPAALLARAVERLPWGLGEEPGTPPARVGRITYEILGPVPIAPLEVEARVVRPGRSVEMVEAELGPAGAERPSMRATAWRLRTRPLELPEGLSSAAAPAGTRWVHEAPPGRDEARAGTFPWLGDRRGYGEAVEYEFGHGDFTEAGPASVWMRMRVPLLEDEEPSPLVRIAVVADAGNGVSATLEWDRYVFINVDLTIHLARELEGEWVCLDSITFPEPDGTGLTDTALWDESGPVGRAAQTLLVREREG